jgi:hypothetical protein
MSWRPELAWAATAELTRAQLATPQELNVQFRDAKPTCDVPMRERCGFQLGDAAGVVLVGAVDGGDERAGVEEDGHAGRFRRPRMISSWRSDRSPRRIPPVIDRLRRAGCS